jgi:hypothetical protein
MIAVVWWWSRQRLLPTRETGAIMRCSVTGTLKLSREKNFRRSETLTGINRRDWVAGETVKTWQD